VASDKYEIMNRNSFHHKKRFGGNFIIFLFFLIVIGIILFSTVYESGKFTGKAINPLNQNNSVNIETSLSVPEIVLRGEYKEIFVSLNKGSFIYLDNKKISLNEIENNIIISDFIGDIKISENSITQLEGKISELQINKIPINLQDGGKLKFSLSSDAQFKSFEIREEVSLNDVSFIASGNIYFEGDSLVLNSEKIQFINYFGNLKVQDKKLILEGIVENVNVYGKFKKVSLLKY
jgi:hypothetical protein